MKAAGESFPLAGEKQPCAQSERTFCRDMDRVRPEVTDAPNGLPWVADETDLVVKRHRNRTVAVARHDKHIRTLRFQITREPGQRVDDAVGLRMPCVGDERKA